MQIERNQESHLRDGTWASPEDAHTVIFKLLHALGGASSRLDTVDFVAAMRLYADDLDALANSIPEVSLYRKVRINDILASQVFDVASESSGQWCVPPDKAVAVLKNTVIVECTEQGDELYLQEPFETHTVLADTWLIVQEQTTY